MIELLATLYVLGAAGAFLVMHTVVEAHDAYAYEPRTSKNTMIGREIVLGMLWPGLVALILIMLVLPDRGEGIRHWIMTGER
jgi:hypothetical protein